MNEIVQVEKIEPQMNGNDMTNITSTIMTVNRKSDELLTNEHLNSDEKPLLKTLLSSSTAITSTIITKTKTAPPNESMITKEVNDTQLNLKKILYEPDKETTTTTKEKDQESNVNNVLSNGAIDIQGIDDDDRLVIDISDDDKEGIKRKKKLSKPKSMPLLGSIEMNEYKNNSNQLPKSITYSLDARAIGVSSTNSCVKIDILDSSIGYIQSDVTSSSTTTSEMSKSTTSTHSSSSSSKHSNLSSIDELKLLSHEVDKQITKKTNEIVELIKEYLGNLIDSKEFHSKMSQIGNISIADLVLISKKLVKRHKFEVNPNQRDFTKMKHLQFPTSSQDLVNYFENLLPSINNAKFMNMISFYEILIKEMLNLNKTKILQYLIDFMVKRKNAQLDLLNYHFEPDSSPNFKHNVRTSTATSTFQIPDSTQNIKIERRPVKLNDTSYNFIIRSDPIYLTAASTFMTNHRDVITCRSTPAIQTHTFERRPFDNNVLKGRRISRRIICNEDERRQSELKLPAANVNNLHKYQHPIQIRIKSPVLKIPEIQTTSVNAENSVNGKPIMIKSSPGQDDNATIITPIFKAIKMQSTSPILVESDSPPSSSPPIHKIHKPQIISSQLLHRAFSERPQIPILTTAPVSNVKPIPFPFPSPTIESAPTPIKQHPLKRHVEELKLNGASIDPIKDGQISLNELKTLNQNGTEIIPTSSIKNRISSRRKTIDVDRSQTNPHSIEVKKVVLTSPKLQHQVSTASKTQNQINNVPPVTIAQPRKIAKRRQSCHERFVPSTTSSDISKNFIDFLNQYEYKIQHREMEIRRRQMIQNQKQLQENAFPQSIISQTYAQPSPKRVRFTSDTLNEIPKSPQITRAQFVNVTQHQQQPQQPQQSPIEHPRVFQLAQRSPTICSPSKPHPPSIDYQHYQMYFERELRERGYVDRVETLQDRETVARPLELVSHVTPDRYIQQSDQQQQQQHQQATIFANPKVVKAPENSPRVQQRTPTMMNDEKALLVACHQLQSLHRDPSTLTAEQYAQHLKQRNQIKQLQAFTYNNNYQPQPQNNHGQPPQQQQQQQHHHAVDERRESNYFQNTQQSIHKSPSSTQYDSHLASPKMLTEYDQEQSLQRKLKLKSKSSKYIEPCLISKPFYNPPHSTYYSDPYAASKKPSPVSLTPTNPTAFHAPPHNEVNQQQQQQQQRQPSPQVYRNILDINVNPQVQYPWTFASQQHHHQQQQQQAQSQPALQQQNIISHNQPARPIPRQAIPSHLISPHHNSLHAFQNQQSEIYRHYFHSKNF